jgi:signal transduction histidine kinase/ActR/RegA family two-component response regulator
MNLNFIKDKSIKKKLIWLSMTTCGLALFSACFFFTIYELKTTKSSLQKEILLLAKVIAQNSIGAIEFDDKVLAYDNLSSLDVDPRVSSAAIYSLSGKLFISYSRKPETSNNLPNSPGKDGITFTSNSINIFYPIEFKSKRIGTIYICAGLNELTDRLKEFLIISAGVLVFSMLIGIYLSSKLQKLITIPIEKLKRVASGSNQISKLDDLDDIDSGDEIGDFSRAFKEMLSKLRSAEMRLTEHSDQLELLVQKRTNELESEKIKAEKANQAKSEFLSQMSHELRTPLNAILGFAQLMEYRSTNKSNPEQMQDILQIIKAGKHLLSLINEILDLSKIESGNQELVLEPVKIGEVLSEVCIMMTPSAEKIGITLAFPKIDTHRQYIYADRIRFKQILINIISNAIKYNSNQGRVDLKLISDPKNIQIEVIDTGMGIPDSLHQKIFEPFYRMDNFHDNIEGTGIGLPISKKLAEDMGGEIILKSQTNVGSTFIIKFPAYHFSSEEEFFSEEGKEFPNTLDGSKEYCVLYIEDNEANTVLVKRVIETTPNISFLSASRAEDGIQLANEHKPDIILMDLHMPGMDGVAAFKILRNTNETKSIPIIAVSADAMDTTIQKMLSMGFHSFITKPVSIPDLLEKINSALETLNR